MTFPPFPDWRASRLYSRTYPASAVALSRHPFAGHATLGPGSVALLVTGLRKPAATTEQVEAASRRRPEGPAHTAETGQLTPAAVTTWTHRQDYNRFGRAGSFCRGENGGRQLQASHHKGRGAPHRFRRRLHVVNTVVPTISFRLNCDQK